MKQVFKGKILRSIATFILSIVFIAKTYAITVDSLLAEAYSHYSIHDYTAAQQLFLNALTAAEKSASHYKAYKATQGVARCHYFLRDNVKALEWSSEALHIAIQYQIDSVLPQSHYLVGAIYAEAENVDSAEFHLSTAARLMVERKDYTGASRTYSALTELYLNTTGNLYKVDTTLSRAEYFGRLSGDNSVMAFAATKRYNLNFRNYRNFPEALRCINRAESLYVITGNREAILNAYRAKAEVLILMRDTGALVYMLKWFDFKDSIFNTDKAAAMAQYESLYNAERRERENKILLQQKELTELEVVAQTRLVFILTALLLLVAGTTLWIINRNRLKRKKQELKLLSKMQQEKERIARDLHDNIGGQLSFMVHSLDGIEDAEKTKRTEIAVSLRVSVRSVISSLRETIWAISDDAIRISDFSDKLKVYTRNLLRYSGVKVIIHESILTDSELSALTGLNLYRVCQEIVTNIYKHSDANEVTLQIISDSNKIGVVISDNGRGFDIKQQTSGYGLGNIQKRAAEFGFTIHAESQISKGTTYSIVV